MTALLTQPGVEFIRVRTLTSDWWNVDPFAQRWDSNQRLQPFDDPDEPSDLDYPITPIDDDRWDVFLPDEDPDGPRPEPGDFWIDADEE
jgi:hypothetical protein